MDNQDQVQNIPPKDVADQQPKIEDTNPVAEEKETISPDSSQAKSEEGGGNLESPSQNPTDPSSQDTDNSKASTEEKPESDEKPKQDESLAAEAPASDQLEDDKETLPQSDSLSAESGKSSSDPKEESEPSVAPIQDKTPEASTNEQADVSESEPKEESPSQDAVLPADKVEDDSDATVPKEIDSSQDVPSETNDSLPKEENDTATSDAALEIPVDQAADESEIESTQKDSDIKPDKDDSVVLIPGEQNGEMPVSNNVDNLLQDNSTAIPSAEVNGSTVTPDKPNDASSMPIDDEGIPSKTNGPSPSSPSKEKNYCAENWLVVLAICLIILTIIAAIVLAAIIIPILGRKTVRPFRLPGNVIPEHYILEIRPVLIPDHSGFDGSVVITVVCVNATNKLVVHSNELEIDEDSVGVINQDGGHSPFVLKTQYDIENEFVIFTLCENLKVGTKYDIHISFKGKFSNDLLGLSMVTYEKNGEKKHIAQTKFESIYARRAFPCFDEPALKATFDVNVVRWKNMTSLSNMKRLATLERDKYWEIDMYQRSVPMSTYLVTFVVGELESIQKGRASIWAARDIDYYQYALNVTDTLLEFFESYLQVPYSISKLDQFASEEYWAGMENWGIIIYKYQKIKSGAVEDKEIARIISHELAHQWFGNLVTMKWWDELWLNEGFATYFGYLGSSIINEEWKMRQSFVERIDSYMVMECNSGIGLDEPIVKPSRSTHDVKRYLRRIVYYKGAAVVRMMHLMLGDSEFRRGLKAYLRDNSFKSVGQDDLFNALTRAQIWRKPIDMKKVIEPWLKQPFYPLITVTRNYRDHEATVEQTSCINAFVSGSKDLWPIPITWIDGTPADYRNTSVKLILYSEKGVIRRLPGKEVWILVNVERLGYFRVNYDPNNWELLLWQLRHNYKLIPTLNRRQLILDAMYFAKINQLSHIVTLDILTYFPFEKEEIVMRALIADNEIYYYGNMVRYTSAERYWKEFVEYLFKPIFIKYSRIWEEKDPDHSLWFAWLASGILCYEGYGPCLSEARKRFSGLFNGNLSENSIDSYLHETILCALAKHATREEWNRMNQTYAENNIGISPAFLACTEDDQLFKRLIKEYLSAAGRERGRNLVIRLPEERWRGIVEFMEGNWKTVKKEDRYHRISILITQPHNKETLKTVTDFYKLHKKELSDNEKKNIDHLISEVTRLIPNSDAVISVAAWLTTRSWEDVDIREID